MKKRVVVISLGGSIIIPDEIDDPFLKRFRNLLLDYSKKYNFIIVTGGGSIARKYISSLKKVDSSIKLQNFVGISATRMNARFMSYFFGINQLYGIPHTIESIERYLGKNNIVFCGALDYKPNQTSDSTSAQIAAHFGSEFINMTNVDGLFDKDPKKHSSAKLIREINWKDFLSKSKELNFSPGQHFVLDQKAAKIIFRNRIKTFIIGKNLVDLKKLLDGEKFFGTTIFG